MELSEIAACLCQRYESEIKWNQASVDHEKQESQCQQNKAGAGLIFGFKVAGACCNQKLTVYQWESAIIGDH